MGTLFLSFMIAIGGAVGFMSLSRAFDLDTYTNRIIPLIPILYAIIYEVLERRNKTDKTDKTKPLAAAKPQEESATGGRSIFQNITAARIITNVAVSFVIKFGVEIGLVALFIYITGQSFSGVYGSFGIETVGRFLRGDHPWLEGSAGLTILALLSVITSFGTGLWIGYLSRGNAILEGVFTGAAVTVITAMTNMLILYRRIEEAANQMAASFGYGIHIGFAAVLMLQVLLYGLWSGIVQKTKEDRQVQAAVRKSLRKARK